MSMIDSQSHPDTSGQGSHSLHLLNEFVSSLSSDFEDIQEQPQFSEIVHIFCEKAWGVANALALEILNNEDGVAKAETLTRKHQDSTSRDEVKRSDLIQSASRAALKKKAAADHDSRPRRRLLRLEEVTLDASGGPEGSSTSSSEQVTSEADLHDFFQNLDQADLFSHSNLLPDLLDDWFPGGLTGIESPHHIPTVLDASTARMQASASEIVAQPSPSSTTRPGPENVGQAPEAQQSLIYDGLTTAMGEYEVTKPVGSDPTTPETDGTEFGSQPSETTPTVDRFSSPQAPIWSPLTVYSADIPLPVLKAPETNLPEARPPFAVQEICSPCAAGLSVHADPELALLAGIDSLISPPPLETLPQFQVPSTASQDEERHSPEAEETPGSLLPGAEEYTMLDMLAEAIRDIKYLCDDEKTLDGKLSEVLGELQSRLDKSQMRPNMTAWTGSNWCRILAHCDAQSKKTLFFLASSIAAALSFDEQVKDEIKSGMGKKLAAGRVLDRWLSKSSDDGMLRSEQESQPLLSDSISRIVAKERKTLRTHFTRGRKLARMVEKATLGILFSAKIWTWIKMKDQEFDKVELVLSEGRPNVSLFLDSLAAGSIVPPEDVSVLRTQFGLEIAKSATGGSIDFVSGTAPQETGSLDDAVDANRETTEMVQISRDSIKNGNLRPGHESRKRKIKEFGPDAPPKETQGRRRSSKRFKAGRRSGGVGSAAQ
ncbi:hypothetical protein B0T22DRAFT_536201 [Podospora appendiculata]|uniref:Uncharacterized protein n=1 Tax=Podospora appendiculata TaxID=314037 RepID=A0AAE0XAT3_9PEZI|nr:hypothetical protein B0T22DRAFT_536201 [Podospora appendiculata]